jgi:hypothetical protein
MQENVDQADKNPADKKANGDASAKAKLTTRRFGIPRLLLWGGRLFSWGCVFFVLMKMSDLWAKFGDFRAGPSDWLSLGIIAALGSVVTYAYGYMWGSIVECLSGTALRFADLAHLYAKSNLAKYLPGNVMHYVSRSVLAKNYRIPLQTTALASLLDAVLCALSALLFAAAALRRDIFVFVFAGATKGRLWAAGAIFAAALSAAFWALKKVRKKVGEKTGSKIKLSATLLRSAALYCLYDLFMACIFYRLLSMVDASSGVSSGFLAFGNFGKIAGLYTLAWLTGYLVPGASGGIGVREAMLLALLRPFFPQETILASALLLRILTIVSEIFAYTLSVPLSRNKRSSA